VLPLPRDNGCDVIASLPSRLLDVTGFEADLRTVDLAVDLMVAVDNPDVLGLGAALERTGAATQFEVFNEDDGVSIRQDGAVGIFDDTRAIFGRGAFTELSCRLLPLVPAGRALPHLRMADDFGHRAFGAGGGLRRHGDELPCKGAKVQR